MNNRTYPWYDVVGAEDAIAQGDFIDNCPMTSPPRATDTKEYEANVRVYNVVVMSQSCDLSEKKLDLVLVCPYWPLQDFEQKQVVLKSNRGKEALRRGQIVGHHLLNRCEISGFETGFLVVDFRSVYSVPFEDIVDLARGSDKRLRLLPPYREQLSQAFARFVMRVGLPIDIPTFAKETETTLG